MKIVVNTRSLILDKLDGIGWFTYQSLKRITQNHPEHEFIFLFDRPWDASFIFSKNVTPVKLIPPARHPFLYVLFYELSVRLFLNKTKPDLFLAPDGLLSLGATCKQLAVVHDINYHHYPKDLKYFYSKYYNYFVPKFVKRANKIVTVSEFSKLDIANNYKVNENAISVVYNGINEGYEVLSEPKKEQVRRKYSKGLPYFLFVGSQSPRKNLVRLIEAFDSFKEISGAPHQLLLAGSSFWGEEKIKLALQACKHRDSIQFTGRLPQSELQLIMGSAFALTFVSYFEGFGIPIIEAMQCGVPVLCSNTSCMPEIGSDSVLYVDPFHVNDISLKMQHLYESPELVQELIKKGFERKNAFSWDHTAEKLWEAILETTNKQT